MPQRAVALVTDSNAQLTEGLRSRYGIAVVPLTVVVDGIPYHEGVDLDAREFWARLQAGAEVGTAAPSPGEFVAVYEEAVSRGARSIVSVHVGSNTSGIVGAARLAARASAVPVEVVDTGTASFGVAACAWAAAEVLECGGDAGAAAAAARRVAPHVRNVFVLSGFELARRGGRLAPDAPGGTPAQVRVPDVPGGTPVPVLALEEGRMRPVANVEDLDLAVEAMATYLAEQAAGRPTRVAVGHALVPEGARALARRVSAVACVAEVVEYEIGPSVGVHTGPGTLGAVSWPAPG